jgi:acyl-CoA thioesterase-1
MLRSSFIALLLVGMLVSIPIPAGRAAVAQPVVLVLGDSLSAGHGIDSRRGWVSLLESRLVAQGYGHRVVNASASGETTGGGLARLDRALALHRPDIVIIELGANDALRGLPLAQVRGNLGDIISRSLAAHARVVLLGMRVPPNYGPAYAESFAALYGELAGQFEIQYVPFFLEDVALDPALMQDDGLHPTERAQTTLLDNVWPALEPLLDPGP